MAATNSIAEPLGQAATQAPQPMQAAASIARSAWSLATGMSLASGAEPQFAVMKPPCAITWSNAERSTQRSLITGNAWARHGSIQISSPSLNSRMWSWQVVVARLPPCGRPLIISEHVPQMPSRQS